MIKQWKGRRVRIPLDMNYADEGREGVAVGEPLSEPYFSQPWLPVRWDDEEDPDWFQADMVEALPRGTDDADILSVWNHLAPYIAEEADLGYGESQMEHLCEDILPKVWDIVLDLAQRLEALDAVLIGGATTNRTGKTPQDYRVTL